MHKKMETGSQACVNFIIAFIGLAQIYLVFICGSILLPLESLKIYKLATA